jgi:hypothetical protein
MDAYRVTGPEGNSLNPSQVEFAVKKYRRHRKILVGVMESFE